MSKAVTVTIKMRADGSLFVKGFPTLKQNYQFCLAVVATLAATVDPKSSPALESLCQEQKESPARIIPLGKGGRS